MTKALEKAISALPDTPLKTSLQTSLPAAAAQLLEHLRPEEPAVPKPRAKRAKTTREAAKEEPAVPAAPSAPTILDSSLEAAVEAILNGESPSNIDAIGALVSRFPPPQGLLEWQLLKMYPAASGDAPNLDTLLTAAEKALQACNALAGQAALREEALATFQPALSMMLRAARVLEQSGSQTASGDAEHLAQWQTLKMLSSRALVCMDLVGKEINAVNGASDGGAPADQASRWWLRRIVTENGSVHDALAAARTACAAAVSLCTSTQLCELGSEGRVESLAALAGHSMRVLAPYAAAGQMAAGAETNAEDVGEPREGAILFVALYLAAAEQSKGLLFVLSYIFFLSIYLIYASNTCQLCIIFSFFYCSSSKFGVLFPAHARSTQRSRSRYLPGQFPSGSKSPKLCCWRGPSPFSPGMAPGSTTEQRYPTSSRIFTTRAPGTIQPPHLFSIRESGESLGERGQGWRCFGWGRDRSGGGWSRGRAFAC